ncbi:MAG: amino acid ABC transporter substrate-binding protein [Spirochaetales bacterium]|nr:amino acid ABC transporter substrate-binding protein [Spirochaetales bacterium]
MEDSHRVRRRRRRPSPLVAGAALSLALVAVLSGCARAVLRVALLTKLESGSLVGASEANAATLFLEERASAGKAGDIEVVPYDDAWLPDKALLAYERARADGIDFFITSHTSTCAIGLEPAMRRDGVFAMVTGSATTALSGKDDLILRNVPDLTFEQERIADYVSGLPGTSVLVLRDLDNGAYTEPAFWAFSRGLVGKDLRLHDVRMSALDLGQVREAMLEKPFDVLYVLVGAYQASAGTFAQLAASINPEARIVFTPWLKTPALAASAGRALERSTLPSHYPAKGQDERVDGYIERFEARFGYVPTFISLNVYAGLETLAAAWDSGARTPLEFKRWILERGEVPTSFGTAVFDRYGDSNTPIVMIEDPRREFE